MGVQLEADTEFMRMAAEDWQFKGVVIVSKYKFSETVLCDLRETEIGTPYHLRDHCPTLAAKLSTSPPKPHVHSGVERSALRVQTRDPHCVSHGAPLKLQNPIAAPDPPPCDVVRTETLARIGDSRVALLPRHLGTKVTFSAALTKSPNARSRIGTGSQMGSQRLSNAREWPLDPVFL